MPKKNTKKGHGRADEKEEQDMLDELKSNASEMSDDADNFTSVEDQINDFLDDLQSKRGATRISAIQKLNDTLSSAYLAPLLANKIDTISLYLGPSIKKGSTDETVLACRTLSLMAVTLGDDSHSIFKDYSPILEVIIKNTAKSPVVRAAAIRTLAMLSFITSVDKLETQQVLDLCNDVATAGKKSESPDLTAQALDSFGLLATTVTSTQLATTYANKHLPLWVSLLEQKDLDVRSSAGENIALVYEAINITEEDTEPGKVKFDDLVDQLQELATDSSKRKTKTDKKKQRATFREIVSTVEEGTSPSKTLTLNKEKHTLEGWVLLKQLEAITDVLGSGLPIHFAKNPMMGDIFGVDAMVDDDDEPMGGADNRSKRSRQADFKAGAMNNFLNKQNARSKKTAFLHQDD